MAYNYVTVTFTWSDDENGVAAGRYEWYTSATIIDTTTHEEIDEPVILGQLDSNGSMSVSLLAMDNPTLSSFNWVFQKWIQGEESIATAYEVYHANGASQTLDSLTTVDS